ncbi:MAG TPA: VOC family protein [Geopsychrobacteraceae bacterium]|nr:VOC family protein [Geopsychrobacteraceae bacterium]
MNEQITGKCKMIGINHVALEVGDIDDALDFYGRFFDFTLRGRSDKMAFIDMGDQFIALAATDQLTTDRHRHFGLVVDDRSHLKERLKAEQIELIPGKGLNFHDPWGNYIQVVEYRDIQFSKTEAALRGMNLKLDKTEEALGQLRDKGMR